MRWGVNGEGEQPQSSSGPPQPFPVWTTGRQLGRLDAAHVPQSGAPLAFRGSLSAPLHARETLLPYALNAASAAASPWYCPLGMHATGFPAPTAWGAGQAPRSSSVRGRTYPRATAVACPRVDGGSPGPRASRVCTGAPWRAVAWTAWPHTRRCMSLCSGPDGTAPTPLHTCRSAAARSTCQLRHRLSAIDRAHTRQAARWPRRYGYAFAVPFLHRPNCDCGPGCPDGKGPLALRTPLLPFPSGCGFGCAPGHLDWQPVPKWSQGDELRKHGGVSQSLLLPGPAGKSGLRILESGQHTGEPPRWNTK